MAIKIITFILLIVVIFAIFRLLTRRRHESVGRKPKLERLTPAEEGESRWGTCKSCGQRRIIMKEGMCAFCWSSSQTHGLK
ncbi:MAG: hypothetical protein C4291_05345 [Candidatus Dadabacteria bacterium]